MKQEEDIISMARDADPGFEGGPEADGTMPDSIVGIEAIARFAQLVAAKEQERCIDLVYGFAGSDNVAQRTVDAIRARSNHDRP